MGRPKKIAAAETDVNKLAWASVDKGKVISRKSLATGVNNLTYRDIVTDVTVRNTSNEDSYYSFRPSEELPTTPKGIIALGMSYYKKNPIVKNTFDTMSEFAANDMVVPHKSEIIQEFYKNWLQKVGSYDVNEQFCRLLLKAGVTPIHRSFIKVTKKQLKEINLGLGFDQDFPEIEFVKSEIPISYSFLNPLSITLPNERMSLFLGRKNYYIEMPEELIKVVKNMSKKQLIEYSKELPPDIAKALKAGETKIPIDPYKTSIYHYKKDDFEVWGEPVHACIFDDLLHFDKTKLADRTTLDSIASRIRLWMLGHIEKENNIFAPDEAYEKLSDMIASIPSGGVADIIWNRAIDVIELSKDAHLFLSPEKYKAPLSAIYQGLGVPRTVNDDNSFNNSYFGLKTMVERLNYLRNTLKSFWNQEFKLVHKAMGFAGSPPEAYFDEISITDKSQMMALVRDLCDRNVISEQEVQRLFNTDPKIEAYRIKKQNRRQTGQNDTPPKAGPFHTNHKNDLEKIALTKGITKPGDVGVKTSLTDKQVMKIVTPQPKGQPKQGRPKNAADKKLRKKRIVKPRSAMANLWYSNARNKVHELVLAKYLEKFGKKNYRQLSTASTEDLEKEVFGYTYNLSFGSKIDEIKLDGVNYNVQTEVHDKYNSLFASFVEQFGRTPTIDEQRVLQIEVCLDK